MTMRRVAVMIGLDWPLNHHHQIFAGIQRFAQESRRWECLLHPYADLLLADPGGGTGLHGIVGRITPRTAARARRAGVSVVNVWLNTPARGLPGVFHDSQESGAMAAQHLLDRGLRTFAYLGAAADRNSRLQLQGFRAVLQTRGLSCSACLVAPAFDRTVASWQRFQKSLGRWIEGWSLPIGVLAGTDLACRYLAEACRHRQLRIPQQVALVGSGNEPVFATVADPTLSSIDFGFERVGHRAAALLDELMAGAPPPRSALRLAPAGLVIRQSSDAFVVADPLVGQALRFISGNLRRELDVETVAAQVLTTPRTLARRFQAHLGRSIHQTITQLRIEHLQRQLVASPATIKTLAAECGFHDAIHLSKVFQRVVGTSPGAYRAARTPWPRA